MPTLIVSCAWAVPAANASATAIAAPSRVFLVIVIVLLSLSRSLLRSDLDLNAEKERVPVRASVSGQIRVAGRVIEVQTRVVPLEHEVHADLGEIAVGCAGRLVLREADVRLVTHEPRARQEIR